METPYYDKEIYKAIIEGRGITEYWSRNADHQLRFGIPLTKKYWEYENEVFKMNKKIKESKND